VRAHGLRRVGRFEVSRVRAFRVTRSAIPCILLVLVVGCTVDKARQAPFVENYARERLVVRSGDLSVAVSSPRDAATEVQALVERAGGFVERSTETNEPSVWLSCRVPKDGLESVMDSIAGLGDEVDRSLSSVDVTEEHVDLETRLRNNRALVERLRQLLEQARDVKDIIAIETELNRIQTEIETMQARFDRLNSDVELSTLGIRLEQQRILGPLGYLSYGIVWAISKLFVIR
jgi:hypothetical protein